MEKPVANVFGFQSSKIINRQSFFPFVNLRTMKIGVLALQGDFAAHRRRLEELGAEVVEVRKPEQLDDIDGLVIPSFRHSSFSLPLC